MKNILVSGLPRSGTSWISKILSVNKEVRYIHEPDNERHNLLGYIYKKKLSRFPCGSSKTGSREYIKLFQFAFSGIYLESNGALSKIIKRIFKIESDEVEKTVQKKMELLKSRPDPPPESFFALSNRTKLITFFTHLMARISLLKNINNRYKTTLIKSVHSFLALDCLIKNIKLDHIIFVTRHPAAIISSHIRMGNKDIWRPFLKTGLLDDSSLTPYKEQVLNLNDPLTLAGARIGAVFFILEKKIDSHKKVTRISYEQICRKPIKAFKNLYEILELDWNERVVNLINHLDREGKGYSVKRKTSAQINKWEKELSSTQIEAIEKGFSIFPLQIEYTF